MEQFSSSNWSGQADAHVQGLKEAKQKIEEFGKQETELDTALKGTALTLEQRGVLFGRLKAARAELRDARFALEQLEMKGGQNLKKAA